MIIDSPIISGSYLGTGSLNQVGNVAISGSLTVTGSIIGNLTGTASFATTASHALNVPQTASYALNATSASYAANTTSASYAATATSASYAQTASYGINIIISGSVNNADYVDFNTSASFAAAVGRLGYDSGEGTLTFGLAGGNVTLKVGSDLYQYVYNNTTSSMTLGQVVYASGSQGNRIAVKLASATAEQGSANTLGFIAETIPAGGEGWVLTEGNLRKLNTVGLIGGKLIFLGTTPGTYTQTPPVAPAHGVRLGYAERIDNNVGSIYVKIDNGYELGELHDVIDSTTSSSYGDLLVRSGSVWINSKQLTGSYGVTGSINVSGSIVATSTITAQTLVVQTVTSSIVYSSGSNIFGNDLSNTQILTGSVSVTGSLAVNNSSVILTNQTSSMSVATASYAANAELLDGKDSSTFATTGSNTFIGNQTVTGSLFTSGSNTLVGITNLTGALNISGSETVTGYIQFMPVSTNINQSLSASYIYVSGSTNDLYFTQNGSGYGNTTRLRWIEGSLYSGLLHGGLITTQSSTVYQVSSGSGIIVNLNASYDNDPYPTIKFITWPNLSASIAPLSASYDQTFVAIDENAQIYVQGTPYNNGQFDTDIPIGVVVHQNRSTINGTQTFASLAYGWKQRSSDFIRAFGPLKLSGFTLAPSGSSTGSLIVASGTAWSDGRNYTIDPNNPSYITDAGTTVSKIFRYRQSGSAAWVYDTNGGAGYATIDPTQYSANGVLTAVSGSGATRGWSIQRVYWFPNSATKGIYVYYGNAQYPTDTEAIANINVEPFIEAPNTAAQAVYLGALILRNDASFTVNASYKIIPSGLFRNVGGSGGGGSIVTQTLSGLSDVLISGPTDHQPFAYDTTAARWTNQSSISASLKGNADTATSASYAATASFVTTAQTASFVTTAQTASYVLNAVSSSFALTASYISGSGGGVGFPFSGSAVITGSLLITNLSGSGVRYVVADANGLMTAQTASAVIKTTQAFTATAGQTTFAVTNGYSTGYVDVFVNGTKLNSTEFTDTSGTNVVLATGSFVDDVVEVVKYLPASGVSNNVLRQQTTFTASASQTVFSASYTPGLIDIFYNGSRLSPNEYTANNGTYFTLATASAANDILDVFVYSYQVGAFSGIGGTGAASQIAYFNTSNSITGSPNFTISGSTMTVTGSLLVSGSGTFTNIGPAVFSGSITSTAGFTGSFSGTATSASYADTASFVTLAQTASFVANAQSASNAVTAQTASFANTFTVASTLTAQTLVVQTITSSVDYVTGSTRFGSLLANTHQFTGSVSVTGSLAVVTTGTELQVTNTGVNLGNAITDTHNITGSFLITGSLIVSGSDLGLQNNGITINRTTSGEPYIFFRKDGVNRASIYGVSGGGLRVFDNNDVQVLTITSSFVGIGTSDPGQTLEIRSADGRGIRFKNSGSSDKRWDLVGSGNDFRINETGVGAVMAIKAGGSVGINETSPLGIFHVRGIANADTLYRLEPTSNSYAAKLLLSSRSSGDGGMRYGSGGGNNLDIFSYGDMRFYCGTANLSGTVGDLRMIITNGGNIEIQNGYLSTSAGSGTSYSSKLSTVYTYPYIDTYLDSIAGVSYESRLIFRTNTGGGSMGERMRILNSGIIYGFSSGADASYQPVFGMMYTANNNETNVISTAVSSVAAQSGFRFDVSNGGGSSGRTASMYINRASVTVVGSLSKGSGSFRIKHPLASKKDTHKLVHSFIEGPQADLIYRGKVTLVNGQATVNIDEAAGMTEGTFEALCREVQCFTSNETSWDAVRGKVEGNILTIECQNTESTDEISWLVVGERQDEHMMETEWTDENGKVIVEPLILEENK